MRTMHLALLGLVLAGGGAAAGPLPPVESVTFTRLAEPAGYIQVVVRGRDMIGEWTPRGAAIGRTELIGVVAFPDGRGLTGLLPPEPPDGGELLVHGTRSSFSTGKRLDLDAVGGAPRAPLDAREDCKYPVVPGASIGPIKLGMTEDAVKRLGAAVDPQNSVWLRLGPVTAKVDRKSGKVDLMWIERPTLCLVDGGKQRKLELPRPRGGSGGVTFPYPDCPYPTQPQIGGACFACTEHGLEVCYGSAGWFPTVKVKPSPRS